MKEYQDLVKIFKEYLNDEEVKVYLFRPAENSEPNKSVVLRPNLSFDLRQNNSCKTANGTLEVIITAQSDLAIIGLADKLIYLRKKDESIMMLECQNPLMINSANIIEGKMVFRLEILKKNKSYIKEEKI